MAKLIINSTLQLFKPTFTAFLQMVPNGLSNDIGLSKMFAADLEI